MGLGWACGWFKANMLYARENDATCSATCLGGVEVLRFLAHMIWLYEGSGDASDAGVGGDVGGHIGCGVVFLDRFRASRLWLDHDLLKRGVAPSNMGESLFQGYLFSWI